MLIFFDSVSESRSWFKEERRVGWGGVEHESRTWFNEEKREGK